MGCADQAPPTFIQAAWVEVEAPLDPQDFHTAEVFLYDSRSRRCKAATVGLTSLLISARTQSAPQWTWASFERRDNAPGPDDNRKNGDGWLFFDGGTPSEDCALSPRGPACTWNQAPDSSGVHRSQPSQIVREQALPEVDPASDSAGAQAATLLREISATNPWNQLVLVGALWGCPVGAEVDGCSPEASPLALPAPPNAATCPPAAVSAVLPDRLDNTVLLPYAQGGPSCWTCHSQPRVAEAPPRDHRLLFSRSP